MKVYDLSGQANTPCFVIKYSGVSIMIDCHLDTSTLHRFLPISVIKDFSKRCKASNEGSKLLEESEFIDGPIEFTVPENSNIEVAELDIILLTSHVSLLALPFITEHTSFSGCIYATEPVITFGKLLMEELVENVSKLNKNSLTPSKQALNRLNDAKNWRERYNRYDVTSCINKISLVAFNQIVDIAGGLKVKALSSGYSIGSCNWVVYSDYHKISYIGASSVLSTHTMLMSKSELKDSDVVLVANLSQNPLNNPDNFMREFCLNTSMTLKKKGKVLVPCMMVGVVFDLIDCLFNHLDSSSLLSTPVYVISPIAKSSLAFSNIYAEWLSSQKQSKVYQPDAPFAHSDLIKSSRLEVFSSASDEFCKVVKHPCVVFCCDQHLRYGDAVDLMVQWKDNSNNSVIFTDPTLDCLKVLAPYLPMKMKVFHCPIDTRLSPSQANKLLKEIQIDRLVVPQCYINPYNADVSIASDLNPLPLTPKGVQKISLKRNFQKVTIDSKLAESLEIKKNKKGTAISLVSGYFCSKDYKYVLKPFTSPNNNQENKDIPVLKPQLTFNPPNSSKLVEVLAQAGIEAEVQKEGAKTIVFMKKENSRIEMTNDSTDIIFNEDSQSCIDKKSYKIIKNAVLASTSI